MQTFARTLASLFLCTAALAQPPAPPKAPAASTSPVGHWIADHPSEQGLSLAWDFRPDGSLTTTANVFSNQRYLLDGATLTITTLDSTQVVGVFDAHFADGKLYTVARADHPPTIVYSRIGPRPNPTSEIVGTWKVSDAPHTTDPEQEKVRNRMMNMIVVYSADGSYQVRAPLAPVQGKWDATAQTYTLKNFPPLHYERSGDTLKIALPPAGKETQLYLKDTLMDHLPQP